MICRALFVVLEVLAALLSVAFFGYRQLGLWGIAVLTVPTLLTVCICLFLRTNMKRLGSFIHFFLSIALVLAWILCWQKTVEYAKG